MIQDKTPMRAEKEVREKITDIVENYAEAMQTQAKQYPEFIAVDNILKCAKPYYIEKGRRIGIREMAEAYDGMLDGMGKGEDNFKASDWAVVQALKGKANDINREDSHTNI